MIISFPLITNSFKHPQVLLAKLTNKQAYKDKVQGYVDYLISSQKKTPKGLVYIDQWGTLRHAANSALIALQVNSYFCLQSSHHQAHRMTLHTSSFWPLYTTSKLPQFPKHLAISLSLHVHLHILRIFTQYGKMAEWFSNCRGKSSTFLRMKAKDEEGIRLTDTSRTRLRTWILYAWN